MGERDPEKEGWVTLLISSLSCVAGERAAVRAERQSREARAE
jgi:hypothetical protein